MTQRKNVRKDVSKLSKQTWIDGQTVKSLGTAQYGQHCTGTYHTALSCRRPALQCDHCGTAASPAGRLCGPAVAAGPSAAVGSPGWVCRCGLWGPQPACWQHTCTHSTKETKQSSQLPSFVVISAVAACLSHSVVDNTQSQPLISLNRQVMCQA
jgi:hypothetical protein